MPIFNFLLISQEFSELLLCLNQRKFNGENRAAPLICVFRLNRAAVLLDQFADERHAQTKSGFAARRILIGLGVAVKDRREKFGIDSLPVVLDDEIYDRIPSVPDELCKPLLNFVKKGTAENSLSPRSLSRT